MTVNDAPTKLGVSRGQHWMFASEPPFNGPKIHALGWWGCPDWLIRGEPIREALWDWEDEAPDNMEEFLAAAEADLPGRPVEIGRPRLCENMDEGEHQGEAAILHPLSAPADRAVAPVYFAYIEAVVRPDKWRAVNGKLGGLNADGELVVCIAPARVPPKGWK